MKKLAIISLLLLVGLNGFGQEDSLKIIDDAVFDIDSNKSLILKEYDATEVYGHSHSFDGGGVIQTYSDANSIVKIYEQIGLSYGSVTTIIYFSNGTPIKIIDSEGNFALKEDGKGLDYTKLNEVFKAEIYIFDWEKDSNKTIITGKRNQSEGTCGIFEYEGLIDKAKDLTKCSALDLLLLKNEKMSTQLFNKIDSVRSFQYPNNDQEVNISVDLTKEYLKKFLDDIDKDILSKTGRDEKEYHFNVAPKGFSDPKICMDKISVEFSSTD